MRRLPDSLLRAHHCLVMINGKKEEAYQQHLRLGQALWRIEQGLPEGGFPGSPQGAWIPRSLGRKNFLTENAWVDAQAAITSQEKFVDESRLLTNLVSSQPLCFNLFSPLKSDLGLASKVVSRMLEADVEVTGIEFEYSPGRGDPRFTGDRSASDIFVKYRRGSVRGCLGIEVKHHESLIPHEFKDRYRPRYSEVAGSMGCFREGSEPHLRAPQLEQLWRDHLLVGSILIDRASAFDEGQLVLLYPSINASCVAAEAAYREHLTSTDTFTSWTLESVVEALKAETKEPWVRAFEDRYLGYQRADHAWQAYYLSEMIRWASEIRRDLGEIQKKRAATVQFRPTSGGVTMVSLLPESPQLGKSYSSLEALIAHFDDEFSKHCEGSSLGRSTPEKALQSFLVSNAQQHGGHMNALNDVAGTDFTFLTDEIVIPSHRGDGRFDILAVRDLNGTPRPCVMELKSNRAMTELLRQTHEYGLFVEAHLESLSKLATAVLGREIQLRGPVEKWIVWPAPDSGEDTQGPVFERAGVGVIGYRKTEARFEFVHG